jgi:hypothetical protein
MTASLFSLIKFNYLSLYFAHFDSSSFISFKTLNDEISAFKGNDFHLVYQITRGCIRKSSNYSVRESISFQSL